VEQTQCADHPTEQNAHESFSSGDQVYSVYYRNPQEQSDSCDPDSQFKPGIDAKGMLTGRDEARQGKAAQTQPAHVGSQQHSQGTPRETAEEPISNWRS